MSNGEKVSSLAEFRTNIFENNNQKQTKYVIFSSKESCLYNLISALSMHLLAVAQRFIPVKVLFAQKVFPCFHETVLN